MLCVHVHCQQDKLIRINCETAVEEVQSNAFFFFLVVNETLPVCPDVVRWSALYSCGHVPGDVDGAHLFSTLFSRGFPYLIRLDRFTVSTAEARYSTTVSVAVYPRWL